MTAMEFVNHTIDELLLADLKTLEQALPKGGAFGACGYSMLMAVFSGVELLGALSGAGEGTDSFRRFWEEYLYPAEPRRSAATGIYEFARHGIAHDFRARRIEVWKNNQPIHLTRDAKGTVYLDATQMAADFESGYQRWKQDLRDGKLKIPNARVERILKKGRQESPGSKKLENLPAPPVNALTGVPTPDGPRASTQLATDQTLGSVPPPPFRSN